MRQNVILTCCGLLLLAGSTRLAAQSPTETAAQEAPADSPLGSTATADSLTARTVAKERNSRVHLTLYPAKEPARAMQHLLWPQARDLTAGDAQTSFYRAVVILQMKADELINRIDEWSELPTGELPWDKVETELRLYDDLFLELERMASRENQSLNLRVGSLEGEAVYRLILPEMQQARTLARLLKLKADFHVQRGEYDAAMATWRTTFRLAGLVGSSDLIVSQLIGVAISHLALTSIEQAMVRPDCPNLYWALAALPRPLVNFRQSVAMEHDMVFQVFPLFRDADRLELSPEAWHRRLVETFESLTRLHGESVPGSQLNQNVKLSIMLSFVGTSDASAIRQRLQASGWTEASVASMSIHQLVALDTTHQLRYWSDRTFAPFMLPSDVARPLLAQRMQELQEWSHREKSHSVAAYIFELTMPALQNVNDASVRSELLIHQLMTIEAIRMQMANDGQFPSSLTDLRPVPALLDPVVREPFEYTLQKSDHGVTAILRSRAPDHWSDELKERRLTMGGAIQKSP